MDNTKLKGLEIKFIGSISCMHETFERVLARQARNFISWIDLWRQIDCSGVRTEEGERREGFTLTRRSDDDDEPDPLSFSLQLDSLLLRDLHVLSLREKCRTKCLGPW